MRVHAFFLCQVRFNLSYPGPVTGQAAKDVRPETQTIQFEFGHNLYMYEASTSSHNVLETFMCTHGASLSNSGLSRTRTLGRPIWDTGNFRRRSVRGMWVSANVREAKTCSGFHPTTSGVREAVSLILERLWLAFWTWILTRESAANWNTHLEAIVI